MSFMQRWGALIAILITSITLTQQCPSYFVELAGRCYFFGTTGATWFEAWQQCSLMGSSLVSIETTQESKAIMEYIVQNQPVPVPEITEEKERVPVLEPKVYKKTQLVSRSATKTVPSLKSRSAIVAKTLSITGSYWTSGTSLTGRNNWVWLGSGLPIFNANWCPNQPDNKSGLEHCIKLIISGSQHCWNDRTCFSKDSATPGIETSYICEINRPADK